MEDLKERELRQGLRHFERVWSRVRATQDPKAAAERCGVKLMQRKMRESEFGVRNGKRRGGGR